MSKQSHVRTTPSNLPTTPLFVRLPTDQARRLDRAAFEHGTSKRELVSDALVRLLDGETTVGRAEVVRSADPEVLTVEMVAELLRVDPEAVRALAREGGLPARKIGREWRFSRTAVLRWLAGED
jgi:excisionase family DNA binding protein